LSIISDFSRIVDKFKPEPIFIWFYITLGFPSKSRIFKLMNQ
jgi:hypothetical protein